jgi:L-alanine-DL-glutamate epimerase-like enolase superfamily enzyme
MAGATEKKKKIWRRNDDDGSDHHGCGRTFAAIFLMIPVTDVLPADLVPVTDMRVSAYCVPTDLPESDGTLQWTSTTLVLVEIKAGNVTGIGYTYADPAAAETIGSILRGAVIGQNALDIPMVTAALTRRIRNNGNTGLAMMAVSAVDNALWDTKAKILGIPLCSLLGKAAEEMRLYGSGGFTSYTERQLKDQLTGWVDQGIGSVKIKIGRDPGKDPARAGWARKAIGKETALFVDANGAYSCREALRKAEELAVYDVRWLEEPVSSDFPEQLAFIRGHVPPAMQIAAGEYGSTPFYFLRMLEAGAVDVLQADATRCGGISGFLKAGQLAEAYGIPFSSHCAPALHLHAALSLPSFYIAEYFHDHVRIESLLFEGVTPVQNGSLRPDPGRPGIGLAFKYADAKKYIL